jgi:hypothetical protein
VGKSKHNKTLLRYRSQKKDNMFLPFEILSIYRSLSNGYRNIKEEVIWLRVTERQKKKKAF